MRRCLPIKRNEKERERQRERGREQKRTAYSYQVLSLEGVLTMASVQFVLGSCGHAPSESEQVENGASCN